MSYTGPEDRKKFVTTPTPGVSARHAIISDQCRINRGNEGAIDEALARIREEFLQIAPKWELGNNTTFHVVLTVCSARHRLRDDVSE